MADYISREAAVKIAQKYGLVNGSALGRHTGLADCIAIEIEGLPAADVEPVRRWILYKDRPPKECGRYQAVVKSEAFTGSSYIDTLTYDKFGWRDGCCYVSGVSHWMPLPEPPEEENA